jgi:hypothetical protein
VFPGAGVPLIIGNIVGYGQLTAWTYIPLAEIDPKEFDAVTIHSNIPAPNAISPA